MKTPKELKSMINSGIINEKIIVNVVLNYEAKIKYVQDKIKEYTRLYDRGFIDKKLYLELYESKLEELKVKRNTVLDSLTPCEIVLYKESYYLKYYVRFNLIEDYILYNKISKKELFLYPKLKIRKRVLKNKKYNFEAYTSQFINKVFEMINDGIYKIVWFIFR